MLKNKPSPHHGSPAIVYARAPPSFQARYFSFRPPPLPSPLPYAPSPSGSLHMQSVVSLPRADGATYSPTRSISPYGTLRTQSPAPSGATGQVLRLTTTIASALFSKELEYLYTGKGLGAAFEFLFETDRKEDSMKFGRLKWCLGLVLGSCLVSVGLDAAESHPLPRLKISANHRFLIQQGQQ